MISCRKKNGNRDGVMSTVIIRSVPALTAARYRQIWNRLAVDDVDGGGSRGVTASCLQTHPSADQKGGSSITSHPRGRQIMLPTISHAPRNMVMRPVDSFFPFVLPRVCRRWGQAICQITAYPLTLLLLAYLCRALPSCLPACLLACLPAIYCTVLIYRQTNDLENSLHATEDACPTSLAVRAFQASCVLTG